MSRWTELFLEEEIEIADKYMENCSTSIAVQGMQIKTILGFHITPVRVAIIMKQTATRTGKNTGEREP
jgi:hypothetical protein